MRGTPDVLCGINGYFVAMELKRDADANISKLQQWTIENIVEAGNIGMVVFPGNWTFVSDFLLKLSIKERK